MKKRKAIASIKRYLDVREAVDDLEWEIEVRMLKPFGHAALRAANTELWRIIGKSPP